MDSAFGQRGLCCGQRKGLSEGLQDSRFEMGFGDSAVVGNETRASDPRLEDGDHCDAEPKDGGGEIDLQIPSGFDPDLRAESAQRTFGAQSRNRWLYCSLITGFACSLHVLV